MENCQWCKKEIHEHELHINDNNFVICSSCLLKLHKVSIEQNLVKYDSGIPQIVKSHNIKILSYLGILLLTIILISYILKH